MMIVIHSVKQYSFLGVISFPTETADEEHLPFKALWSLLFNSKLRLYVEPEALHNMWNDLKNSYKRADLQPALLLGIVMSQSSHGPFGSGHHQWTKQQTAELLAESMTTSDFENIRESMTRDRYGDTTDIPESPSDLPDIPSVANFPIFVAWSKLGSTLTSKSVSKTLYWK